MKRPNGRSAKITLVRRLLGRNVRHTEWLAFVAISRRGTYNLCRDRTLRSSLVVHHLG